jgi:2-methylisocitrate lyase-like PEP mutase family enzyme
MPTQADKVETFRALHAGTGAFVMPNPWDVGTARLLTKLGFSALATTSAGYAFSIGKRDNGVGREPMLAHVAEIVAATDLPVNADLENGFGDDPKTVAETMRRAAATGIAGGSIEDATGNPHDPIYPVDLAVERVRAAVEAVRGLRIPFVLTARAENFITGRPDLADTIARLQAYQEAGADVLFAPGLVSADDIATVVRSVDRPVNVLMGRPGQGIDLQQLGALGVKRVSVGSAFARAALGALLRAAREVYDRGTFDFAADAVPYADINGMFD